jgi:pyrimidine operon attenuation protein/uracil phosphoribosyltransferase
MYKASKIRNSKFEFGISNFKLAAASLDLRSWPASLIFFLLMRTVYDASDVGRTIEGLVDRLAGAFSEGQPLNIVGIRTRGEILAERLTHELKGRGFNHIGRGVLDITLYRDDLSEIGPRPIVRPTEINISIDAAPLLLVDDVLFTGRSVRAALDAISDFGRPGAVRLVVLVDRGGRELPIQADFVGLTLQDIPSDHRVNVRLSEIDGRDEILVEPKS